MLFLPTFECWLQNDDKHVVTNNFSRILIVLVLKNTDMLKRQIICIILNFHMLTIVVFEGSSISKKRELKTPLYRSHIHTRIINVLINMPLKVVRHTVLFQSGWHLLLSVTSVFLHSSSTFALSIVYSGSFTNER